MLCGELPRKLNLWQEAFCEWNAQRLTISVAESRERFGRSWAALAGGHRGRSFKIHSEVHRELCLPFWDNSSGELQLAYAAHEPLQFLRLLSHDEPDVAAWPEFRALEQSTNPRILDFGCGLAQLSIAWTRHLRECGQAVELFLVDLPLLHLDFLRWLCHRWELPATILSCTPECPIPPMPPYDLCLATEVLEHVYEPEKYLQALAAALRPGGFLLTNLADHSDEFLHVSPRLSPLREHLANQGWKELRPYRLYQKP